MAPHRRRFLQLAGLAAGGTLAGCSESDDDQQTEPDGDAGDGDQSTYGWQAATFDAYWYSLYNMSTNIAMSANGVLFPHNESQREQFRERLPAMLQNADVDAPPVKNPNLNMAPFTSGDPHFTTTPVLAGDDDRPDADTLVWDPGGASGIVSPASVAWTHLKGVTWAKNFQNHFDILPPGMAPKFRAQMLATVAQIGTAATLVQGGPDGNGALTKNPDENLLLVSGFRPADGTVTDETPRPLQHAAMLWFLADLNSLAANGWFGYVNPEPLIPAGNVQKLLNGMGKTVMQAFPPVKVVEMGTTRDLGVMLGAAGYFGTQTETAALRARAVDYLNALAGAIDDHR